MLFGQTSHQKDSWHGKQPNTWVELLGWRWREHRFVPFLHISNSVTVPTVRQAGGIILIRRLSTYNLLKTWRCMYILFSCPCHIVISAGSGSWRSGRRVMAAWSAPDLPTQPTMDMLEHESGSLPAPPQCPAESTKCTEVYSAVIQSSFMGKSWYKPLCIHWKCFWDRPIMHCATERTSFLCTHLVSASTFLTLVTYW